MPVRKVVEKKKPERKISRSVKGTPKTPVVTNSAAFKPGNQLWKKAGINNGRPNLFADSKVLWQSACEYFQWCEDNPIERNEPVKFEGSMTVEAVEVGRPYTLSGLCVWLGCAESYFRNCRSDKSSAEFLTVVDAIEQTIRDQQISGAVVNVFNGPIVARLQSLIEKTDVTTKGESVTSPAINIYNTAPPFALGENEIDKTKKDEED